MTLTQPSPERTTQDGPSASQPLLPLNAWPIQFSNPEVGFAWYVSPGILVTQATAVHANGRIAAVLSDWVDLVLEAHREEFSRCGGMLGIHDWRRFRSYDSDARRLWMERIRRRPKGYLRKGIIIVGQSPLIKMAVAGANMIVTLATGGQFEIATNASQVIREYDVRPPRA
ncbi:MAG TPA: hypothetical protein VIV60_35800 [Polyangiaceae bacterium]